MYNVSIITVCFNDAEGLKRTCESIRLSGFPGNHIIVDGGSTDESIGEIRRHSLYFQNLTWISERDKGVYDAMNKAIALCKTEFMWFINSGDMLYGNCPQQKLDYNDNVLILPVFRPSRFNKNRLVKYKRKPIWLTMPYNHQGCIFRNSGHRYNYSFKIASDYEFILANGGRLLPINIGLYIIYKGGGISFNNRNQKYKEMKCISDQYFPFYFQILLRKFYYAVKTLFGIVYDSYIR